MSVLETYIVRAAECRQQAQGTTLANVRDRLVRSALAWEGMADQLRVTEMYRLNELERKAQLAAAGGCNGYSWRPNV